MKRWRLRTWLIGALVACALGGAVAARVMRTVPTVVQTDKVVREDLTSTVSANGEIKPLNSVDVGATAYGQITEILVKEGDRVKKGQLLAQLEAVQPKADVEAQSAALRAAQADRQASLAALRSTQFAHRSAQADVVKAQAESVKAERELDRMKKMVGEDIASRADMDSAVATFQVAQATLSRARATVAQTAAQEEQAQAQDETSRTRIVQGEATLSRLNNVLSKATFVAPIDGIVTRLPVHVGESMVMGIQNSPGSLLMTIADMSIITAEVHVDETDILSVALGQAAEVTIDAIPDKTFKGTVTEIGNSAIAKAQSSGQGQEAKEFKVVVTLHDSPASLRPGLSTTARIETAHKSHVLAVPMQALVMRRPSELIVSTGPSPVSTGSKEMGKEKEKDIQGVFIVHDGKALFAKVDTGITGTTDIEVKSGVAEGDEVVTGSSKVLRTLKPQTALKVDNAPVVDTSDAGG